MEAIRSSGLRIGIDPLGGAAVNYWQPIIERYKINAAVVNATVDPTFAFMPLDWDGKIRMDCSSPFAMKKLLAIKDKFDLSFGNDTDADRHGIVCRSGLMQPNNYLAVCIDYLKQFRENWPKDCGIGKTIVSSSMIDRVAARHKARLVEVPVGFKWFVDGLIDSSLGFGGEESAGASFLRRDGNRLDDRQGWAHRGPARRRNHRPHQNRSRRTLPQIDRRDGPDLLCPDR